MQPLSPVRMSHPMRRWPGSDGCASRRTRLSTGFTLVEMLVVFVVLATVAGLLMPVLAHARASARQSVCLSQMRQITQAHLLFRRELSPPNGGIGLVPAGPIGSEAP